MWPGQCEPDHCVSPSWRPLKASRCSIQLRRHRIRCHFGAVAARLHKRCCPLLHGPCFKGVPPARRRAKCPAHSPPRAARCLGQFYYCTLRSSSTCCRRYTQGGQPSANFAESRHPQLRADDNATARLSDHWHRCFCCTAKGSHALHGADKGVFFARGSRCGWGCSKERQ